MSGGVQGQFMTCDEFAKCREMPKPGNPKLCLGAYADRRKNLG
jgi:hypothetical protein